MILLVSLVASILSRIHDDALEWLYLMIYARSASDSPGILASSDKSGGPNNVNSVNTEVVLTVYYIRDSVEGTIASCCVHWQAE
jgi:hypothetical protein